MNPPPCRPEMSDLECKIILDQAARRAMYRQQFLMERTDPCKHCKQSGFVFDEAMQRFNSMKVTQIEHFAPNKRTIKFGLMAIVMPMLAYGTLVWTHRNEREKQIRCGCLRYKDRLFKFC